MKYVIFKDYTLIARKKHRITISETIIIDDKYPKSTMIDEIKMDIGFNATSSIVLISIPFVTLHSLVNE